MKIKTPLFILAPVAISFLLSNVISLAQMPQQYANPNQTAMIFYPVELGPDGKQYITTKAGYKVSVPGLGIAPNAGQIAVYRDPQNNFWYVDKNGNPTPVSPQQMQSVMSQMQTQSMQRGQVQYGQYPQRMPPQNMYGQAAAPAAAAAPVAAAPSQPQQSSNNNNGSSALMTGLAAAGGAAMGSMVTNSMYNNNNSQYGYGGVPYGAPVYKQPDGQYYYANQAGKPVYVAPNSTNAAAYNEYDKQPSAYSGQQAQAAYQQQQNEQNAAKQQNEQKAQSAYTQQQTQNEQKQQQTKQMAEQNEGSGRRRGRHKEESASGQSVQATAEQNGSEKRKARLRRDAGSGEPGQGDDAGRLGRRF